jgi:translation elongation factor EF-G
LEFAKVRLTLNPAKTFEVEDRVEDKELEKLNVGWPDSFILGIPDVLMNAAPDPLTEVRVTLEQVWYHDADSSREAFRNAGHDAGHKIIAVIGRRRS